MNTLTKTEYEISPEQIDLIKAQLMKQGATDDELRLFLYHCKRTGLDPIARQIYAIKRWDSRQKKYNITFQVSIDGFRLVAERTGEYEGQTKPEWCDYDGKWRDVWLKADPPAAARIGVWRTGFKEACYAPAKFDSYAVRTKEGNLNEFWSKMPEVMIAKVAEALALRKAFPQELSGLYTTEEMQQADNIGDVERQNEREVKATQVSEEQLQLGEDLLHSFTIKIKKCASLQELTALGTEITPELSKLTQKQVEKLRSVFAEVRETLKNSKNGGEPPPAPVKD